MTDFPIAFLDPSTPEWETAWQTLREITGGNGEDLDHDSGEVWQYMGTVYYPEDPPGPGWLHEFRHRGGPTFGDRTYRRFPASPDYAATLTVGRIVSSIHATIPPGLPDELHHLETATGKSWDPINRRWVPLPATPPALSWWHLLLGMAQARGLALRAAGSPLPDDLGPDEAAFLECCLRSVPEGRPIADHLLNVIHDPHQGPAVYRALVAGWKGLPL